MKDLVLGSEYYEDMRKKLEIEVEEMVQRNLKKATIDSIKKTISLADDLDCCIYLLDKFYTKEQLLFLSELNKKCTKLDIIKSITINSFKEVEEQKEEKNEETKILKNEYKLYHNGYSTINKELNNRIDYYFPEGYEHVIIKRHFADTYEFISENKYQGFLYKNSLKTYNKLKEMKGK